jgi:hypothetical protein
MRWISHLNKKALAQCRGTIAGRATIAELIWRICRAPAKRFRAKRLSVCVKKTRQKQESKVRF